MTNGKFLEWVQHWELESQKNGSWIITLEIFSMFSIIHFLIKHVTWWYAKLFQNKGTPQLVSPYVDQPNRNWYPSVRGGFSGNAPTISLYGMIWKICYNMLRLQKYPTWDCQYDCPNANSDYKAAIITPFRLGLLPPSIVSVIIDTAIIRKYIHQWRNTKYGREYEYTSCLLIS